MMKILPKLVSSFFNDPRWLNVCRIVLLIATIGVIAIYSIKIINGKSDLQAFLDAANKILAGNDIYTTPSRMVFITSICRCSQFFLPLLP